MARGEAESARGVDAARADVESVDAIIAALYDAISFEPGGGPDWDRLRTLFHPDGRLVPPRSPETGELPVLTVEGFIHASTRFIDDAGLREQGFHEVEVERELERIGAIAHAWSTYESRYRASDEEPFSSGINSIQMVRDETRWFVLHIVWDVHPD